MPFDNICKRLAEFYPRDFASWLLGQPLADVEVLKTELSREPLRMLDYWVQGYRKYETPIEQFVIVLVETGEDIATEFRAPNTWHRYNVIKLWEMDSEIFLSSPGLLPLAAMTRASQPQELLKRVVEQTMKIPTDKGRAELVSCAAILPWSTLRQGTYQKIFPGGSHARISDLSGNHSARHSAWP
jgi:predicted transposase YdaD